MQKTPTKWQNKIWCPWRTGITNDYDVLPGPHFFWVMRTREEGWSRERERGRAGGASKASKGHGHFGRDHPGRGNSTRKGIVGPVRTLDCIPVTEETTGLGVGGLELKSELLWLTADKTPGCRDKRLYLPSLHWCLTSHIPIRAEVWVFTILLWFSVTE